MFATKNGILKKTPLEEYLQTKKKTGLSAITLKEGDSLSSVSLIKDENILMVTAQGMTINISSNDINSSSRTTVGIKGLTLKEGDHLIAALPIRDPKDTLAVFTQNGLGKKIELSEFPTQRRGGKGLMCYKPTITGGDLVAATLISDEDVLLVAGSPASICVAATDIPLMGRPAAGNQIVKGSRISYVSKI